MKKQRFKILIFIGLALIFGLSFIPNPLALPLLYVLRISIILIIVNNFLQAVFLPPRFFWMSSALVVLFVTSFPLPFLFPVAQALGLLFLAIVLTDILLLFNRNLQIHAKVLKM